MPAVARQTDICSGHSCFPKRPNSGWSSDVIVNGLGWHREGDGWATHCCGVSCHGSSLDAGSTTVYVKGKQGGRIGDPVACGSCVATGSTNVYAGG